jgi:uncharacterized protein with HEPN domain
MNGRNKKTLTKIITHIKRIQEYIIDVKSLEDFDKNSMKKDAIVFNLLQIGELSNKQLTNDFKKEHNTIPWLQIYGLRNRIVHDYDNIHSQIVYQVITQDLIKLAREIEILLI